MKIILDPDKTVHENATIYYDKAKKMKKKLRGVEEAIEHTRKEIERIKKEEFKKNQIKEIKKLRRDKKWFERFHWFNTKSGKLCIGGKDSKQNDLIFKKYMDEKDLFFHADVQGGSVVVLKEGLNSDLQEKMACAQFAASFSKAWKLGYSTMDVYALKKDQLSKYSQGEYVGKGGIAMSGQREWFRNTPLKLRIGLENGNLEIVPDKSSRKLEKEIIIVPGKEKKTVIAKKLSKKLGIHVDWIVEILPSGKCSIKK